MAEFAEVMAQKMRMCKTINNCNLCKIRESGLEDVLCYASNKCPIEDVERTEHIIMEWAKDNPEPNYPSWAEFLSEITHKEVNDDLLSSSIPAHIADRFNIQPKGA